MEISVNEVEKIVGEVVKKVASSYNDCDRVPVGISNRHIHLGQKELDLLFGKGYKLTNLKNLKQPGQYACKEVVTIVGPKGAISNVRILGPVRPQTQVEISKTDSFALGIFNTPIRMSGDLAGSAPITIVGPKGTVVLKEGLIIAANHLHLSVDEAKKMKLKDKQKIIIRSVEKERKVFLCDVIVRSGKGHSMEFHIDTDEANAADLSNNDLVEVIR